MKLLNTPDGSDNQFTLSAGALSQGEVIVTCRGLGGNLPANYGNNIALWSGSLPNLSAKPLKVIDMPGNNWPAQIPFNYPFSPSDYCLTYQTGRDVSTMCALTFLNLFPLAACLVPTSVSLTLLEVTTTYVRVRYTTLPGYQPGNYGNWIGIWGGYTIPYTAPPPLGQAIVISRQPEDIVTIKNLALTPGGNYTLIYFMAKAPTAAGSLLYFSLPV